MKLAWYCYRVSGRIIDFLFNQIFCGVISLVLRIIVIPILVLERKTNSRGNAVFLLCLEHVIKKSVERGKWFNERGFIVYYFSFEHTLVNSHEIVGDYLVRIHNSLLVDYVSYLINMFRYRPIYCEVYAYNNSLRQVLYLIVARCMGIYTGLVLRGETHPRGNYYRRSIYWKVCLQISIKVTTNVLYRELENAIDIGRLGDKAIFDHNCTAIKPLSHKKYSKTVLFLNGFKDFRRVELLANAVKYVVMEFPDVRFLFVGARSQRECGRVMAILENDGVEKYAKVERFTDDAMPYYEISSIFVLTADKNLTFCNYSLIESMERGLVPILSNYEDAKIFVQDGVNGLLVRQDSNAIAKAIIRLLSSLKVMEKMGKANREKIIKEFDNEKRMIKLGGLINPTTTFILN